MNTPRARVLICGYYGFGNAGDELILAGILAELRALRPGLAVTVVSGNPSSTRASHGVEAVHWQDVPAIACQVRGADLVVVGGGGLFQEYSGIDPDSLFTDRHYAITFYAEPAILGALCGRPVMLYAIGVGPLTSEHGRRTVRAACDAAQVITLRDEESARIVAALGVDPARLRVTADPAYALSLAAGAPAPESLDQALPPGPGLLVGVALRHWDVGVASYFWEQELAAGLDAFLEAREARLLFVPFQSLSRAPENDTAVAERVRSRLRHPERATVLPGDGNPKALGAVLGRCDLVVGMRLHAMILAAMSGVPGVALSYDPKVEQAMRQLDAAQFVVPLPDIEARTVAARMEQALAGSGARRKELGERVAHLAELARINAVAAVELLERGSTARDLSAALSEVVSRTVTARLADEGALRAEVAALREARSQAVAAAAEMERARAALDRALEAKSEDMRQLRAELAAETTELEHAQDELARQDEELAQARKALERQGAALEQARTALSGRDEELRRSRAEAAQLRDRVAGLHEDLARIHRSRLWKVASLYWRFLGLIGRLPGRKG